MPESKESKGLFIAKIVLNVIFYAILIFIFICSIANIRAGSKEDTMPNVFGRGYLSVQTDSMSGNYDNSFNSGDMIVVNVIEKNKQEVANNLHVGDIITFYDTVNLKNFKKKLNSHRVVMLVYSDSGDVESIITMGDYEASLYGFTTKEAFNEHFKDVFVGSETNSIKQEYFNLEAGNKIQTLSVDSIRGTYIKTIKNGGNVSNTISQWGLLIVVLPLVIFLIVQICLFVRNLRNYRTEKYKETHKDEIEAKELAEREKLKAELKAQLLKEMEEEKNKDSNDSTDEETL